MPAPIAPPRSCRQLTEREREAVPVQCVELQLRPDDRELAKGGIDDRLFETLVAAR
jgi:hypothetical protein